MSKRKVEEEKIYKRQKLNEDEDLWSDTDDEQLMRNAADKFSDTYFTITGVILTMSGCCATLLTNTNDLTKLDTVSLNLLNHHHSNPNLHNPSLLSHHKLLSRTRFHLRLYLNQQHGFARCYS